MRILIVSEMSVPHATGGGETRYALLAKELVRRGHQVTWLSMKQRKSGNEERIDGVLHLHRGPRIPTPPLRPLGAKVRFMAVVVWHLLRHRYDIVDCQTYAPLLAAWLGCRATGQRLVATIHDTSTIGTREIDSDQWLSDSDRILASRIEKLLYRLPYDRVLTVSRAVQLDLINRMNVPARRVCAVSNGIDIDHIDGIRPHSERCDVLFVGRLIPHKHPEALLDALAVLERARADAGLPPLRATLIGDGPLEPLLRERIKALGLCESVRLLGAVPKHDEVIAWMKSATLLVLPSTREGFGLVLAEAMACGLPVLAWTLPAVAETLGDELADCLLPANDPTTLANAISLALGDPELRERRIAAGARRVRDRYGADTFANAVLQVYGAAALGDGHSSA